MLSTEKLGLIFAPKNDREYHILKALSFALPCIIENNMMSFFDETEADIYKEQAMDEGIEFVGYFDPVMA